MICTISPVKNKAFYVRSGEKAKVYEFTNKKAAGIERAKLVKHMKTIPNMKVRFES